MFTLRPSTWVRQTALRRTRDRASNLINNAAFWDQPSFHRERLDERGLHRVLPVRPQADQMLDEEAHSVGGARAAVWAQARSG